MRVPGGRASTAQQHNVDVTVGPVVGYRVDAVQIWSQIAVIEGKDSRMRMPVREYGPIDTPAGSSRAAARREPSDADLGC